MLKVCNPFAIPCGFGLGDIGYPECKRELNFVNEFATITQFKMCGVLKVCNSLQFQIKVELWLWFWGHWIARMQAGAQLYE